MDQSEATHRADAVSQLWDLKRLSDQKTSSGMPFVHFSMLLDDPVYRDGILAKAERSNEPALQDLAGHLRALNLKGRLRQAAPNGSARGSVAAAATGDSIRLGNGGGGGGSAAAAKPAASSRLWLALAAAVLVMLAGVAYWQLVLNAGPRVETVAESILEDTVWKSGRTYNLTGLTFVESNARLTIEPGVTVRGSAGSALIVTRDASLHARGRSDQPIVFTSAQSLGKRQAGDWGGLVLLGNAPVNRDAHIEGIEKKDSRGGFGGNDEASSCGVLDYVRVEFAGFEISKDNELNGLTLGGCGSGTVVRNVQVHRGLDDGIEVFGGTVDLKNIIVTGPGDDGFDWDMGWRGRVQHLIVQMHPDTGDNAFEGDNFKSNPDIQPRSAPHFANVTLVNDPAAPKKHRAMTVRRGSGIVAQNVLIEGFVDELIDLRDEPVAALVRAGQIEFAGVIAAGSERAAAAAFPEEADDDAGFSEADYFARRIEFVANTGLGSIARSIEKPAFTPAAIAYSMQPVALPQGEFWDEGAEYFGAVRPGNRRNWLMGWTAFPVN